MNRVVIADDDFLVRTYLKQMIPWQDKGFLIIGDAKNGQEAMQLLQQEGADILITDVSMPVMDGIQLTRWVKSNLPSTHILVLSCHDDFIYVKEAMKLGIDDYILKNDLTPETLLEALGKINIEDTRTNGEIEQLALIGRNKLKQDFFRCFDEGADLENLEKIAKDAALNITFDMTASLMILPNDWRQREQNLSETDIEAFFTAFAEMINNVCQNIAGDKVKPFFFTAQDNSHWGILIDFADESDISKVDNLLNDIVKRLQNSSKRYFNLDLECDILPPQSSLIELAYQWQQKLNELHEQQDQLHPAIRSAIKYINEHYREDLSQTNVAEEVYLNPAYFSTLFKKSLGKGFIEYLVDLRMNHVKNRLETGTEKIKDIATTEGFNDYQYFCKLFKKVTGLNPSQYRQKFFH